VVFDALWGAPLEAALTATALGARVIHIGQAAGDTATVASGLVRGKQLTIKGYSNFGIPRDEVVSAYLTMVDLATAGDLTLPVVTTPLSDAASAWAAVAAGGGKQVLISG
jgi:NADPH:quinone reductase-like Zn-dependent oxidoreductase